MIDFAVQYQLVQSKEVAFETFKRWEATIFTEVTKTNSWDNSVNLRWRIVAHGSKKTTVWNTAGRFSLFINGSIYNLDAFRKKYALKNYSDAQTLAFAFERDGIVETCKVLDGTFAIIAYDTIAHELHLIRDYAGVKPLFYGWDGKNLVACGVYRQLLQHPMFADASLDSQVLKLYLQQHFVPAPFGLYKNSFQVRPGEIVSVSKEGLKKQRYWELPQSASAIISDKSAALSQIQQVLSDAIQSRLPATSPIGSFLSGGVDATLIASFLKEIHPEFKVFTIGSDSKKHDETDRASAFAKALQVEHHVWKLDGSEVRNYWEEATEVITEPMADFSVLPTYLAHQLASKHVETVFSGDGGDELFYGYERFWSIGKNIRYQQLPLLVRKGIYGWDKYTTGNRRVNSVLLASAQSKAHQGLHSRFKDAWLYGIAPHLEAVDLPHEYDVYRYEDSSDIRELLFRMRYAEFYGMMQKTLRKMDTANRKSGLNVVLPFLNRNMISLALTIDPLLSYGEGKQKQLLKSLLQQRIPQVPEETTKKGFGIPLTGWLRNELKEPVSDFLLASPVTDFGFDKNAIEALLKQHFDGEIDAKWSIFTLYALMKFR